MQQWGEITNQEELCKVRATHTVEVKRSVSRSQEAIKS
jgi:hypothetical protein